MRERRKLTIPSLRFTTMETPELQIPGSTQNEVVVGGIHSHPRPKAQKGRKVILQCSVVSMSSVSLCVPSCCKESVLFDHFADIPKTKWIYNQDTWKAVWKVFLYWRWLTNLHLSHLPFLFLFFFNTEQGKRWDNEGDKGGGGEGAEEDRAAKITESQSQYHQGVPRDTHSVCPHLLLTWQNLAHLKPETFVVTLSIC